MLVSEIREQKSLFDVQADEDTDSQLEALRQPKSLFDIEPEEGNSKMQTLGLSDEPKNNTDDEPGFWARQFQTEPTPGQKRWDWYFGVIVPVVCVFFDPFIFRTWDHIGGGILGAYRPFTYAGSFISIMLLVTWLLWREKLGGFGALFAGFFLLASVVSLAIGLLLFPFSIVGLVFGLVGSLGFTPFVTSVIFLRNAVRALRTPGVDLKRSTVVYASIVGALWGFAIPFALQSEVDKSLDLVKKGTAHTIWVQGVKLRVLAPLVDPGQIEKIYLESDKNSAEGAEIRNLYLQLAGREPRDFASYD